jgi:putative Holliday junction resolvase
MMPYLAIDLGLKRIGVAYSPDGKIVTPLVAILRKNRNQAANEVKTYIKEYKIDVLVVGIPLGGSSEEEMRRRVTHFVSLLGDGFRVCFEDESNSSIEAQELIKEMGSRKKDGRLDSVAAMVILKRFLKVV